MHDRDDLFPATVLIVGPEPDRSRMPGGHIADVAILLDELGAASVRASILPNAAGGDNAAMFSKILRGFGRAGRGAREVWKLQPDLVILLSGGPASFLEKSLLAGLSRMLGSRSVLCPRSGHIMRAMKEGGFALRWALRLAARLPSVLAVQTETWRCFYIEEVYVPSARVHVVENWVVTPALQAMDTDSVPKEGIRLLYAAPLRTDKGIDDVLAVVPVIAPILRDSDAVLSIIGDGPGADQVRIVAGAYAPNVQWRPSMPRDEFLRFLGQQDILIAPSHVEGFPNLLIEAACLNVAIVASPVGGIPDVIRHGETGVLVPPGRPDRLAAEVKRLIEDPVTRTAMIRLASMEAAQRFMARANVRRLLNVGFGYH